MRLRSLATALTTTALAGLTVLGAGQPAGAHGDTIAFAVTSLVDGHLTVTATWQNDHDPVDEKVAGAVNATSADGRALGPWPLVAVAGPPGIYTTARQLPPGHWKVVVESGFPTLGRGEAELDVTALPADPPSSPAAATATPTQGPSASTAPTVRAADPAPAKAGTPTWVVAVAAAVAATLVVGALLLARRRPTR
ncbi:hypothetical protein AB0K51_11800 [Kitasatospora sp. NPDC049285]|uniref:hypothetical protein n=1 Tax=Kitasatospora sp. NPDC049285 TaxID=3157096 RepID=UPI0034492DB6